MKLPCQSIRCSRTTFVPTNKRQMTFGLPIRLPGLLALAVGARAAAGRRGSGAAVCERASRSTPPGFTASESSRSSRNTASIATARTRKRREIGFHDYAEVAKVHADEKTWTRVLQMIQTGVMPPDDAPQPKPARAEGDRPRPREDSVQRRLRWAARSGPRDDPPLEPGRIQQHGPRPVGRRRSSRPTIFPSDDVGSGFDNIGDVLTLPPLLMEKYLAAAERIAEQTIITDVKQFVKSQRQDRRQLQGEGAAVYDQDSRRWSINSEGSVSAEFTLPRGGQYLVRIEARATQAGNEPAKMEVRLASKKPRVFEVTRRRANDKRSSSKTRIPAGQQRVTARFLQRLLRSRQSRSEAPRPQLDARSIRDRRPARCAARRFSRGASQALTVVPGDAAGNKVSPLSAARQNLFPLVGRAFRRPATDEQVADFARLVESAMADGDSFEQGMQVALTAVLVSPQFLFRVEEIRHRRPGRRHPRSGRLRARHAAVVFPLEQHARRRAVRPGCGGQAARPTPSAKSRFAGCWPIPRRRPSSRTSPGSGSTCGCSTASRPIRKRFPDFDPQLKADMRRETELFCQAIVREDSSVLDFLDGRFTFSTSGWRSTTASRA